MIKMKTYLFVAINIEILKILKYFMCNNILYYYNIIINKKIPNLLECKKLCEK